MCIRDSYYTRALSKSIREKIYFLIPEDRYSYVPPIWVQKDVGSTALAKGKTKTAPFPSFWYCYTDQSLIPSKWLVHKFGPSGLVRSKDVRSKLRYANSTKDIPRDFKGEFDQTKKRPNPKARKRAAKKRRQAAAEAAAARNGF